MRLVLIDDHCSYIELDGSKVMTYEAFREPPEAIKSAIIDLASSQLRQRIDQKLFAGTTVVGNPARIIHL